MGSANEEAEQRSKIVESYDFTVFYYTRTTIAPLSLHSVVEIGWSVVGISYSNQYNLRLCEHVCAHACVCYMCCKIVVIFNVASAQVSASCLLVVCVMQFCGVMCVIVIESH